MSLPKNGSLGRGLGEVMGGTPATIGSAATMSGTGFIRISPDLCGLTSAQQARAMAVSPDFVASIQTHGVLQPVLVRRRERGYEVVAGARRVGAAKLAGLKDVPAMIVQATDDQASAMAMDENTHRDSQPAPLAAAAVSVPETEPAAFCWGAIGVTALVALVIGAGVGMITRTHAMTVALPVPPPRVVVVTNTVEVPAPVVEKVAPAASEFDGLKDKGLGVLVETNASLYVTFDEPVFSSRVKLDSDRADLLEAVGGILAKHAADWTVTIVGHTDAIPPRPNGPYRDNRELGLARATEALRFLMRHDVPATMLEATTAGETDPPFPEDAAKNRTVTFHIRAVK